MLGSGKYYHLLKTSTLYKKVLTLYLTHTTSAGTLFVRRAKSSILSQKLKLLKDLYSSVKLDFWNTFFTQPQIRNETKFHESFIVDMREAFYIQTSPMRYFEFENQPPPVGTKIKMYFHIRYRFPWVCIRR